MSDKNERWGELQPLAVKVAPAIPFPVDGLHPELAKLVRMGLTLTDLDDGFAPMSYASMITSIGMLAAAELDVETLADDRAPFSIFAFVTTQSGGRKNTMLKAHFGGHTEADAEERERHAMALDDRAKWEALPFKERAAHSEPDKPMQYPGNRKYADPTIENLIAQMANGNPYMGIVTGEAVMFATGWSGRSPKATARTFSVLNELYSEGAVQRGRETADARSAVVDGAAMTLCMLSQPGNGDADMLGWAGAQGMAARTLIAEVGGAKTYGEGKTDADAKAVKRRMAAVILGARIRQDEGIAARAGGQAKNMRSVVLAPDANALLVEYAKAQGAARDRIPNGEQPLLASRMDRNPELVARIAACETAWIAYQPNDAGKRWAGESDLTTSAGAIDRAITVVNWWQSELERLEVRASDTAKENAAGALVEIIRGEYANWNAHGRSDTRFVNGEGLLAFNSLARVKAQVKGGMNWRESENAKILLNLIEDAGGLALVRRGRFAVHPDITGGFDYYKAEANNA